MIKRFILLLALFAGLSLSADTDYKVLYWMVEENPQEIPFYYAQVVADDGQERFALKVFDMSSGQVLEATTVDAKDFPGYDTEGSWAYLDSRDWSEYSFYIELLNENDTPMAKSSNGYEYSRMLQDGHIMVNQLDRPTVLTVSAFTAVIPEPTSGLLMILGGMLLGLRRKWERNSRSGAGVTRKI